MHYDNGFQWQSGVSRQLSQWADPMAEIEADINQALAKVKFDEASYAANLERFHEQCKEHDNEKQRAPSKPSTTYVPTAITDLGQLLDKQPMPAKLHSWTSSYHERVSGVANVGNSKPPMQTSYDLWKPAATELCGPSLQQSETDCESKTSGNPGEKMCLICCVDKGNIAFVPCGHTGTCMKCSQKLKRCPFCQTRVEEILVLQRPE